MRLRGRRKGELPAAGVGDEGGHGACLDGHADALDGEEVAVVDVEVGDVDALGHGNSVLEVWVGEEV